MAHPTILRELTVLAVTDLTPTMRRLTLGGDQLAEFAVNGGTAAAFASFGFDDQVKVLVPHEGQSRPPLPVQGPDRLEWGSAGGRPVAKDYTPRHVTENSLDLEFVLHEGGFAAAWVRTVQAGDPAWIVGPTRSLMLPTGSDRMVVAGDETALPAMARLLDEAPEDFVADVVIEVPSPASIQQLRELPGVSLTWTHDPHEWHEAVVALPVGDDRTFCWAAGEAGAVRQIRSHWTASSVARDLLDVTGYWRR